VAGPRPVAALGCDGGQVEQPPLVTADEEARGATSGPSRRPCRRDTSRPPGGQRARLYWHDRSLRRPAVPVGGGGEMDAAVPAVEAAVDHEVALVELHDAGGFHPVAVAVAGQAGVDCDAESVPRP